MFKIPIDTDITYLLDQLGKNVEINGVPSSAIITKMDSFRRYEFDDKRIISKEELKRGDIVTYAEHKFLVINQIVDKRYELYNKGIMRPCMPLNITVNGTTNVVYMFSEAVKNSLDGSMVTTDNSKIQFTMPVSDTTKLLNVNIEIIKFNKVWKIENIDLSQEGLIKITCVNVAYNKLEHNLESEIVNNIVEVVDPPTEPVDPEPNPPTEPPATDSFTIEITGVDKIFFGTTEPFIATILNNGIEDLSQTVTFSLEKINRCTPNLVSQNGVSCNIKPDDFSSGSFVLKATLDSDVTIVAEKKMLIGM